MLNVIENVKGSASLGGITRFAHLADNRYEIFFTEYPDGRHEVEVSSLETQDSNSIHIDVRDGLDNIFLQMPDGGAVDTGDIAQTVEAYMSASPAIRVKMSTAFDIVRAVKEAVRNWDRTMSLLDGTSVPQKAMAF